MRGNSKKLLWNLGASGLLGLAACASSPVAEDAPDAEDALTFVGGKADESGYSECELDEVVAYVNDPATTAERLRTDGIHTRAARNAIAHRDGADGVYGTGDDDPFDDVFELDAVPYVGPVAFSQFVAAVSSACEVTSSAEVIFSPQPYETSHLRRAVELIDGAERSVDIAMYSFRDNRILDAMARATERGVRARVIFEKGGEDRHDPEGTMSGDLEEAGADVRYVNKIMHHKFLLVDGPQDDAAQAAGSALMSGSGNWSSSAGSRYDENTVVLLGHAELALRFQREFDLLWGNSRPVDWNPELAFFETTPVSDEAIAAADDVDAEAFFTSANFRTYDSSRYGPTFSRVRGRDEVSDEIVRRILGAERSIRVASGHLRSRPIAEALEQAVAVNPELDVRLYLDAQEFVSEYTHERQLEEREDCLAGAAGSEARTEDCEDRGFLYAYQMVQAGIPVRFKFYSYRWHYSYAVQMHHKYLVIDDETVITGSYNLSSNAEHATMENVMILGGDAFAGVVRRYVANFDAMWETGRAEGLYDELMSDVADGGGFPIVFDSMALGWSEVDVLKRAMRDQCPAINSEAYRTQPERHYRCE